MSSGHLHSDVSGCYVIECPNLSTTWPPSHVLPWNHCLLSTCLCTPGPLPTHLPVNTDQTSHHSLRVGGIATSKPEPHSLFRQTRTPSREDWASWPIRPPKFLKSEIHPGYNCLVSFRQAKYSPGYFDLIVLANPSILTLIPFVSFLCKTHSPLLSIFFSKFMSPRFHVLHHFLKSLTLIVTDVYKLLGITSLFLTFIIILGNFHICVKHLCKTLSSQFLSLLFSWIIILSSFVLVLPRLLFSPLDQMWKSLAFRAELSMMKAPILPNI